MVQLNIGSSDFVGYTFIPSNSKDFAPLSAGGREPTNITNQDISGLLTKYVLIYKLYPKFGLKDLARFHLQDLHKKKNHF